MMALVVLDEEMAVTRNRKHQLGQPAVKSLLLVPKLMPVFSARPFTIPSESAKVMISSQDIAWVLTHQAATIRAA